MFAHFETGGRKAATPLERSSVVEQLAYIQRVAGSIPSVPIADDDGSSQPTSGQAKVVQESVRADLAAGHTRLRPADAYAPGRDAGRFYKI